MKSPSLGASKTAQVADVVLRQANDAWGGGGGVSRNLSLVINDSFCYKLLKSLLLIGYQQSCHWLLSFVIEKKALWNALLVCIASKAGPVAIESLRQGNDSLVQIKKV